MEGCYYVGYSGWAFGWTQMIPVLVTLVCSVLTTATHQPLYFLFSLFLYIPQTTLWCFQAYFQVVMPDPICQLYHSWAFPSIPAFYVGVAVTVFFAITWLWRFDHSWIVYLIMYWTGVIPGLFLIWYGYNRWWEVLLSLGYGVAFGLFFSLVMKHYVLPVMPYLQLYPPLDTFEYRDTLCMNSEMSQESNRVRKIIQRYLAQK